MRFTVSVLKAIVLLMLLVASAASTWATSIPVRGGSGRGPSTLGFSACVTGTGTACEAFSGTFTSGVTVGGLGGTFSVTQFVFGNASPGTVWNIIDLGPVAVGTAITLPSQFFLLASTGVFACGPDFSPADGSTSVTDSNGTTMTGPCTSLSVALGANDLTLTSTGLLTGINFADLVLESPVPPPVTTTTPEPASIILMGTGLVSLAGLAKRRAAAKAGNNAKAVA